MIRWASLMAASSSASFTWRSWVSSSEAGTNSASVAIGQPTEEMELVYNTVLKAQLAGIAVARAGVTGKEVHQAAPFRAMM